MQLTGEFLSAIQTGMIRSILEGCRRGKPLDKDQALLLSSVQGEELAARRAVQVVEARSLSGYVARLIVKDVRR